MSHQPVIDGFEFASAGAAQQGVWPVSGFARLRELLASDAGEVDYALQGARDERGRPGLRVSVRGTLQLRCQRCLEPMPFEVQAQELLVLAATQAEIDVEPADASAPDRVVAGKEMAVHELIEDQLILELPYAPRHEFCEGPQTEADASLSPFAGLRGLIQRKQ
jgi:uncharacterized protein